MTETDKNHVPNICSNLRHLRIVFAICIWFAPAYAGSALAQSTNVPLASLGFMGMFGGSGSMGDMSFDLTFKDRWSGRGMRMTGRTTMSNGIFKMRQCRQFWYQSMAVCRIFINGRAGAAYPMRLPPPALTRENLGTSDGFQAFGRGRWRDMDVQGSFTFRPPWWTGNRSYRRFSR